MEHTFGARLRAQRECRHVSLTAIAEQTKIRASLLEALEHDDVSHWPGGVFRRAYIRSYAQAIGLDPDPVVREFQERYPDPNDVDGATAAAPVADGRRPPTRLRFLFGGPKESAPSLAEPAHAPAVAEPEVVAAATSIAAVSAPASPDLADAAAICARLARAAGPRDVTAVLADAAQLIGASGLILWLWDPRSAALLPVLSHGYTDALVAQIPAVPRHGDNPLAEAFRARATRVVRSSRHESGALVVPMTTRAECRGVLAFETVNGGEQGEAARSFATILAAQLSLLIDWAEGPAEMRPAATA